MAGVRHRRNILDLSASEIGALTAAFNVLKANGSYDNFIRRHMNAMMVSTPPGAQMNAAHNGPIFLPWHRACLWEMESALLAVNPAIGGLPYWRWELDTSLFGNPRLSPMWTAAGIGPDGDPANGNRVLTGPFKDWTALIWNNTTQTFVARSTKGLVRKLGRDSAGSPTLPNDGQVQDTLSYTTYDASPWNKAAASFRNRLEGWMSGPRMHNQVHRWVGGDMLAGTSPNDPVFWLNHANVDRIWWVWQNGTTPRRPYAPQSPAGPPGHRSGDLMRFLLGTTWTPNSVQDITDATRLGYEYL